MKEIKMMIWEMELWAREGEDARSIIIKILSEISDIIEKYKKGGFKMEEERIAKTLEIIYVIRNCLDTIEYRIRFCKSEEYSIERLRILNEIARDLTKILNKRICERMKEGRIEDGVKKD